MDNLRTIEDYKQPTSAKLEAGEGGKKKEKGNLLLFAKIKEAGILNDYRILKSLY